MNRSRSVVTRMGVVVLIALAGAGVCYSAPSDSARFATPAQQTREESLRSDPFFGKHRRMVVTRRRAAQVHQRLRRWLTRGSAASHEVSVKRRAQANTSDIGLQLCSRSPGDAKPYNKSPAPMECSTIDD